MGEVTTEAISLLREGVEALKAIIAKHQYEIEKVTDLLKRLATDQERSNKILVGDGNGERSVRGRLVDLEYTTKDLSRRLVELERIADDSDDRTKRRVEEEFLKHGAIEVAEERKAARSFRGRIILQILAHATALIVALIALAKH